MKTIDDLEPIDRQELLLHFRGAVRARQTQWDHERCIEKILGREVEIDIANAATCDDPVTLSLNDARSAIQYGEAI